MKRIFLLFIITFLFSLNANSQYKTFEFGLLKYNCNCYYNKGDFITIMLDLCSLDSYSVQLMIGTQKEYNSFIGQLKLIKSKMIEWDSVCSKNNIDNIDKIIEWNMSKKEMPGAWFGKYYNSVKPTCVYTRKNNKSQAIIHTGEISYLMNEYIRCKGGIIMFYSPLDVEEMINAFDITNMKEYINNKNAKDSLLK